MLIYVKQFIKYRKVFPQALSLKQSWWPLIFISFLKQVNHYLSTVEVEKKKTIEKKIFKWTSLS